MNIQFAAIIICIATVCGCAEQKSNINSADRPLSKNSTSLAGTYEYIYPHNSDDFVENHYIVVTTKEVLYYGTSDDFDDAREGYLPGFYVSPIKDFKQVVDGFSFTVKVLDSQFYSLPLSPFSEADSNEPWSESVGPQSRQYTGVVSGDTLLISSDGIDQRLFIRK